MWYLCADKFKDKTLKYAYLYSGWKAMQQRIDEEGCSAVFSTLNHGGP